MSDHPLRSRRTLGAQIAEVRREIAMRHKVYPGLVFKHKMSQGEAELPSLFDALAPAAE